MSKKFRKAFVVQTSQYDFKPLLEICETIVFITNGYETDENLFVAIQDALKDFSPDRDIVIPVGSVIVNLLVGMCIATKKDPAFQKIAVAFYRDREYQIQYF